jgi:hypothetical protein
MAMLARPGAVCQRSMRRCATAPWSPATRLRPTHWQSTFVAAKAVSHVIAPTGASAKPSEPSSLQGVLIVASHGEVSRRLGRPRADPAKLRKARAELAKGIGIVKGAKQTIATALCSPRAMSGT